jgi:hypothetical protein
MSGGDEMTQAILRAECTIALLEDDIDRLERRLADALAALTAIERHEAGSDLGFEITSEHGDWVLFEDLELVRDILVGNSPEQLEDEQ